MRYYPVYLEIAPGGLCLAHVLELLGCVVRAPSREQAERLLPEAIRAYHAWLRRHGEEAPSAEEPFDIQAAAESTGFGPFDPRNAAALFPPDLQAVTPEEIEFHLRLLAHSRADLLAMVRGLPDDLLDWQPWPDSWPLRSVLRHIGNAEEWYVSRLVPAETLPPEWKGDEDLPLFDFLDMERRTAVARLRELTEQERVGLFHPTGWTDHPDEPWTVRKALRRFLEHELEHTGQVREILSARRRWLLAQLAAGRAGLLGDMLSLEERAFSQRPVLGEWTVKDLLAHVAAWDRWDHQAMKAMVAGEEPDWTAVKDVDAANAGFFASWRDRSLVEVLAELQAARGEWVAWLESLPEEQFFRRRTPSGYNWSFSDDVLPIQWKHDAEHAAHITAWRKRARVKKQTGPKGVLLAALAAARQELLAAAAVVPAGRRTTVPVCGEWTLKDVLGHVADWEAFCAEWLRLFGTGKAAQVDHDGGVQAWNERKAAARRDQPWEQVEGDLRATRDGLLEVLDGLSQADLDRPFPTPWDRNGTPYRWVCVFFGHDREHAHGLWRARAVPGF